MQYPTLLNITELSLNLDWIMPSYNRVILMGRVGTDPELKEVNAGSGGARQLLRFRLATSEVVYDSERGEYKEVATDWHTIVMWDQQATRAHNTIRKGDLVLVEGRLRTREWTDASGQKRVSVEVYASTYRKMGPGSGISPAESSGQVPPPEEWDPARDSIPPPPSSGQQAHSSDEDIPF